MRALARVRSRPPRRAAVSTEVLTTLVALTVLTQPAVAGAVTADAAAPEMGLELVPAAETSTRVEVVQAPLVAAGEAPAEPRYYGWQTLVVRLAGVAVGVVGVTLLGDTPAGAVFGALGGLTSAFGPAVVHGVNGEASHAVISALGNLVVPGGLGLGGLAVGLALADEPLEGVFYGVWIGAGAGQLIMTVVDATALGFTTPATPAVVVGVDGSHALGLSMAF